MPAAVAAVLDEIADGGRPGGAALRGGAPGALLRRRHLRAARGARRGRAGPDLQRARGTGSAPTSPAGRTRCGGAVEDAEDDERGRRGRGRRAAYAPATWWSGWPPAGAPRTCSGRSRTARAQGAATVLLCANPERRGRLVGGRLHRRGHRSRGGHRLHPDEGRHRAEAGAQRVLHRGDGAARPGLLQPDDRHGRHQREAARPDDLDPDRGDRLRRGGLPGGRSPRPTATCKTALVSLVSGAEVAAARAALARSADQVRDALALLAPDAPARPPRTGDVRRRAWIISSGLFTGLG